MIKVKHEPKDVVKAFGSLIESCFFCKEETRYWHDESNTPVCRDCAKQHEVSELPTTFKGKQNEKAIGL